MWPRSYHDRLSAWAEIRTQSSFAPIESCLETIDSWWRQSPWQPYYLHWDDQQIWPDPWQLLQENIYCDLARALGMLYTIKLMDRTDCADATLVEAAEGNLVLIQSGKYVLNWNSEDIVNISLTQIKIQRTFNPAVLDNLIK